MDVIFFKIISTIVTISLTTATYYYYYHYYYYYYSLLCFFGYSIIALFRFLVAGMMCWFFCFGFIAGALSSASFLGKEQSPVSAPKRVWNRSETTLKHLPAHHLWIFLCMWVVGLRMAFFCGFRPFSDLFQTNWAVASKLQTQGSSSFLWLQRILPLLLPGSLLRYHVKSQGSLLSLCCSCCCTRLLSVGIQRPGSRPCWSKMLPGTSSDMLELYMNVCWTMLLLNIQCIYIYMQYTV